LEAADNQSLAKIDFQHSGPSKTVKNESRSLKKHYSSIMSLRHFFFSPSAENRFIDFHRHLLHETGVLALRDRKFMPKASVP
jgi:hypothetical protein